MKVHLLDGTYELFRMFFGAPKRSDSNGREVGATSGLLRSIWSLLQRDDVTHVGVAFDHVIESFRNDLFAGYKTGAGIDPDLWGQSELCERAMEALGVVVWPMVDLEADDAIASAAWQLAEDFDQIVLCSPDKDMGQCVRGDHVVLWDRRRDITYDEAGIEEKFGVLPASIPDLLALMGDAADGIPGIPKWGAKSAATVLSRYGHVSEIPADPDQWDVKVRGAAGLSASLEGLRAEAELYVLLATLRTDADLGVDAEGLAWRGVDREALAALCREIGDDRFEARVVAASL